jgi:flavin reductase (DIM6/NTAB) family NADH-FMN oxidoreductase RutF
MLALSIHPKHSSYALLLQNGYFGVSVLQQNQLHLAEIFARPAASDKMKLAAWRNSPHGTPILVEAVAWFEAHVEGSLAAGDHLLVSARVTAGELLFPTALPMNYRDTGTLDESASLFPESFGDS